MEIINYEYYVDLEIAKLLEKAGFDWDCKDKFYDFTNHCKIYKKPALNGAQRWLREVKGLFICVIPEIKDYHATWNFYICNEQGLFYENEDCFLTYEESLEAGIKKALELLLEKTRIKN